MTQETSFEEQGEAARHEQATTGPQARPRAAGVEQPQDSNAVKGGGPR